MNSILEFGHEYLRRAFGWGALPSAEEKPSSTKEIVAELPSLNRKCVLSSDLVQKIATYFMPKDWGRFSRATKGIHALLISEASTREICPILYRWFEKLYQSKHPNVIDLDKLGAGPKLGLPPEYKGPEPKSIQSLKAHIFFLREVVILAKRSEDGIALIVTIPKDWSVEKVEAISRTAVAARIPSAEIQYDRGACGGFHYDS